MSTHPVDNPNPEPPRTFISWAHKDHALEDESVARWKQSVIDFGHLLDNYVDVVADFYYYSEAGVDWDRFGVRSIEDVKYVILMSSDAYWERWSGRNPPHEGAGAAREADALHGLFDQDQAAFKRKVVIVVLPGETDAAVPLDLRYVQRYTIPSLDEKGIEPLLRHLLERPRYVKRSEKLPVDLPVYTPETTRTPDGPDRSLTTPTPSDTAPGQRLREGSDRLRPFLDPRDVTEPIPRDAVVESVCAPIDGEEHTEPRLVLLLGDAGMGKTVIAGQVYDRLVRTGHRHVAIIPCEHGSLSRARTLDDFDAGFGALLGLDGGLTREVSGLSSSGQTVVMVIDTLDHVLGKRTWSPLVSLLEGLVKAGASVVVTCRSRIFDIYLGASSQGRLGHLANSLDIVPVQELQDHEVRHIAVSYLKARENVPPTLAREFTSSLLERARHRTLLARIVRNPYELVMLCATYAPYHELPPQDLTPVRLFQEFVGRKIVDSRKHRSGSKVAHAKGEAWLDIAGWMWRNSGEQIALEAPVSHVGSTEKTVQKAFEDLLGEGIITYVPPDLRRVRFDHQKFTEFSMAYHLYERGGLDEFDELLSKLRRTPNESWYRWQVTQSVLAFCATRTVEHIVAGLDLSQAEAFRATCFGVVEREDEVLLHRLADREESWEVLMEALPFVRDSLLGAALRILLRILGSDSDKKLMSKSTTLFGRLYVRDPSGLKEELFQALDAVKQMCRSGRYRGRMDREFPGQMLENIVRPFLDRTLIPIPDLLTHLRDLSPNLISSGARVVVRVHTLPGVSKNDRLLLARRLCTHHDANGIGEKAVRLVSSVVGWTRNPDEHAWPLLHPATFLNEAGERSRRLRARVVADALQHDSELRHSLVTDFLSAPSATGEDKETANRILICLQDTVQREGAAEIGALLVDQPLPTDGAVHGRVRGLLKSMTKAPVETRVSLAAWYKRQAPLDTAQSLDTYLRLARNDRTQVRAALPRLANLSEQDQQRIIANLAMEFTPDEIDDLWWIIGRLNEEEHRRLGGLDLRATSALWARLLGIAAARVADARAELVSLVDSPSNNTSGQAMFRLLEAAQDRETWLVPELLADFAGHRRASVRIGVLKVLAALGPTRICSSKRTIDRWLEAESALSADDAVVEETAATIELLHRYLRHGGRIDTARCDRIEAFIGSVVRALPSADKMLGEATPEARVSRNVVIRNLLALFQRLAHHEDDGLREVTAHWLTKTLAITDIGLVSDGEDFTGMAFRKLAKDGLIPLDNIVSVAQEWSPFNQVMLVRSIVRVIPEGADSAYLDRMLAQGPPARVREEIWRQRMPGE